MKIMLKLCCHIFFQIKCSYKITFLAPKSPIDTIEIPLTPRRNAKDDQR